MTSFPTSLISALGAGTISGLAYAAVHGSAQITRPPRTVHEATPEVLGLRWEPLEIQSLDGTRLAAWLIPNARTSATVIVLHGHGGNKGHMLNIIQMLAPYFNVLALDVRGHGESEGTWTSVGHFERFDVVAAAEELHRRGLGPIGTLGISMGAAVSILAAGETELLRAVVSDSAFAVLRNAVRGGARLQGYPPGIAEIAAYTACAAAALKLGHKPTDSDPIQAIARISPRPILLIHCECDLMIPISEAYALYAASGDHAELWTIPDLAHAESSTGEAYEHRVLTFLDEHLR